MKHVIYSLPLLLAIFNYTHSKLETYGLKVKKPQTQAINLKEGTTHHFQVTSDFNRNPVKVHFQNEDYVSLSCHKIQNTKNGKHKHRCKIRVKEAPEGSLAIFQKHTDKPDQVLFHISTKNEDAQ